MQGNGEDHANDSKALPSLASVAGPASPFDRSSWFDLLYAHVFSGQKRVNATGAAGKASAWLPLVQTGAGTLQGLTNWYSFSIRPLYCNAPSAAERAASLRDLARQLHDQAARLTLYPVPDHDGSKAEMVCALRAAGWLVIATPAGDRHSLDLGGMTYDQWWATRPGALRNTVARKAKKGVVDIELLTRFDIDAWEAYEEIYGASWKPEEGNPALLRAFAEAEGVAGRLRMGLARIAGAPVAAQFWTVEDGTAFIHKLAHVEDSLKASPGTLLSAALFRHAIDTDNVQRVDFGTGNDRYKRDWMNRHDPLWRLEAFNPARIAAWGPALKAYVRHLRWSASDGEQG